MRNKMDIRCDNRIRILHVVQSAGGVERYIRSFLKYINSEKFCNILVCSTDYKVEYYEGLVDYFENVNMIREINVKSDMLSILRIRKLIKKYEPDIVYCHSSKAGAIGRIANIGLNNKCIYNPHGWAFNMNTSNVKKRFYIYIERFLSVLADRIACISDAERVSALNQGICKEEKLVVVYNGIDFEEYNVNHDDVNRELLGISEDAFIVGCVGRLSDQKAPDVFSRAAARIKEDIPNAYFLMVGDGELRTNVENNFKKNNIHDYKITGWIDNPISYIKLFNVATLLSRWEGFGLVLAEYMLAGKPIVATKVDAIPYIIQDGKNGLLVHCDNEIEVFNAVKKIYTDKRMCRELIENEKKIVREKYDARKMVIQYEKIFINMM